MVIFYGSWGEGKSWDNVDFFFGLSAAQEQPRIKYMLLVGQSAWIV